MKKKTNKFLWEFADLYLRNDLRDLFKIWYVAFLHEGQLYFKFGAIWIRYYGATDA